MDRQPGRHRDEPGVLSRHRARGAGRARRPRRCDVRRLHEHDSAHPSGQLRALAVSSAERYPLLPEVPTMAETVPGIKVELWLGLAAPAGTPKPVVDRFNNEVRRALDLPEVKKWAEDSGVVPAPSTSEEFRAARRERRAAMDRDRGAQQHRGAVARSPGDLITLVDCGGRRFPGAQPGRHYVTLHPHSSRFWCATHDDRFGIGAKGVHPAVPRRRTLGLRPALARPARRAGDFARARDRAAPRRAGAVGAHSRRPQRRGGRGARPSSTRPSSG